MLSFMRVCWLLGGSGSESDVNRIVSDFVPIRFTSAIKAIKLSDSHDGQINVCRLVAMVI